MNGTKRLGFRSVELHPVESTSVVADGAWSPSAYRLILSLSSSQRLIKLYMLSPWPS